MRVLFFGTSAFAVPSLEALVAARHAVAVCVTQPDRPQGRGLGVEPSPVKQAAERLGVPLVQPERVRAEQFAALLADVGVVAAYGQLIPADLLKLPAHGMLGVHPSLLPRYRGAAPVAWAILSGETRTGVTIFRLNARLDAGEMIEQQEVAVDPQDTTETLTVRLAGIGAQALLRALDAIASGRATFTPQDEAQATLAPKFTKVQGRIDWGAPAVVIERLIRGTAPWPGAFTSWGGAPLKILAASVCSAERASVGAGTIVEVGPEMVRVATGQGLLELKEVQPAGRRRMQMHEFLAGRPVRVGERFGGDTGQETGGGGPVRRAA